MAVERKKVIRVHIPNDLVISIFSKLPLKSIKRFSFASKSWSLLLENLHFMKEFRNNFISKLHSIDDKDTCLLLNRIQSSSTLYMLSSDKFEFEERVKIDWPPPLLRDQNRFIEILGSSSVNGILCVHYETTIVLWNPTTGEFKVIPPSIQPYDNFEIYSDPQGFGYDRIRDDYKIIRSARYPEDFEGNWVFVPMNDSNFWEWDMPEKRDYFWESQVVDRYDPYWEIYSLKSNSWRKLNGVDMPFPWPSSFEVNLNEVSHWFGIQSDIVSFDFTNEIFFATTLPENILTEKPQSSDMIHTHVNTYLVVLNESVGYIVNQDRTPYFHIWILGELGVKESWTELFIIGPIIDPWFPMRVGNNGYVFYKKENAELAWLDLSNQKIEEIDGKGMYSSMIVNYKKNFRPIRGMNS